MERLHLQLKGYVNIPFDDAFRIVLRLRGAGDAFCQYIIDVFFWHDDDRISLAGI